MLAEPLSTALEATGYLIEGAPAAATVSLQPSVRSSGAPRLPSLQPDAWWRSGGPRRFGGGFGASDLTVLFKFTDADDPAVAEWQRDVWNLGSAPLLWVVSPDHIDIYNGFARPQPPGTAQANHIRRFGLHPEELDHLNNYAGRLAMETGQFWQRSTGVDRSAGVDRVLLRDLTALESDLVEAGLDHSDAHGLIGRTIFAKYLIDREIVTSNRLEAECGHLDLAEILSNRDATDRLFAWLRKTFNGDMFPESSESPPDAEYLRRVARFLRAESPDGQTSLFPYRFDVIPIELISSVYERFAHSSSNRAGGRKEKDSARTQGVYYTPLTAVTMVLDEVFEGLTGDETVIDLTCGSGVFLVEALRRLVRLKANGKPPTRSMVRKALYRQVYGVDSSESAVQVAAFSLYLAALDLDPDPGESDSIRFDPLVGRTLLAGNAHEIEATDDGERVLNTGSGLRKFDLVVGNPPWTYKGRAGTAARRQRTPGEYRSPRGVSLDFIHRGLDFAHERTRFGVLVSASPFFARSGTGLGAAQACVDSLEPVTLVNLSELSHWLFHKANMPAMALLAGIPGGRTASMELVQVRRSPEGDRSRTISHSLRDVSTVPTASWKRNQGLLKASFLGTRHDVLLVDGLGKRHEPLGTRLKALGTKLASGAKRGNESADTRHLRGLPYLSTGRLGRFDVPADLPDFDWAVAEHPRERAIYRSPIVIVKESMDGPRGGSQYGRLVVAVDESDLVYKDAYFGTSLCGHPPDLAYLLAGILGSALASWYLLMTGSSFGVWKRILRLGDISAMPMPDLEAALRTKAGARVARLARQFHERPPELGDWLDLDEAVCDLYELDEEERIVVRDGRLRASWQWEAGREDAATRAGVSELREYAHAFLLSMDAWFRAAGERRMRAEIHDIQDDAPFNVVRFVLEDHPPPSCIVVRQAERLSSLLDETDASLGTSLARELVGARELRVHGNREVVIVKPAARRHWLGVAGLGDARAVLSRSFAPGAE